MPSKRVSLWEQVSPLLHKVEMPSRYIDSEWGVVQKSDANTYVGISYPGTYEVGQANQALALLYAALSSMEGVSAERVFLPWIDMINELRAADLELFSLENYVPVKSLDIFGITIPHELSYTSILEILDLSRIPFASAMRHTPETKISELEYPLLIGGGPAVFNPEPIADVFDLFFIGEGEEAIIEIVSCYEEHRAKDSSVQELLEALADIPGIYVPSFYEPHYEDELLTELEVLNPHALPVIEKRVIADLSKLDVLTTPIVPYMDVIHNRYAFEILRGCTRGCRFCQAGMTYRPVRERSADEIVQASVCGLNQTGFDEVSLTSLSSADHSQLEEILRRLNRKFEDKAISVSLPSLRVDAFSIDMARLMAGSGRKSGLTFAPEAGSQRMRDVINKNVSEEDLLATISEAFSAGWLRVKLYFMIGLPFETDDDVRAIGELAEKVYARALELVPKSKRGAVTIAVSASSFVPKPHTPFQWEPQNSMDEIKRKQQILRESIKTRAIKLSYHDADISSLEGFLARGDRRILPAIIAAWEEGARFDAWSEQFSFTRWQHAFERTGISPETYSQRKRELDEVLPWSHLSTGVTPAYLKLERRRAISAQTTVDCSFDECTACGVCPKLELDIVLGNKGGRKK